MALVSDDKKKIINQFQVGKGDTGSPEVQIALLSERVKKLTEHLKLHPHDNHSRRGLLSIIGKRRRLLYYLMKKAEERYKEVIQKIGLEK